MWCDTHCRLAAQLARTEEAAKRLMVRSDRSAPGGTAARLLAAEKELSCITASAVETRSAPICQFGFAQDHAPFLTTNSTQPVQPTIHKGLKMMPKNPYLVPGLAQQTGGPT